MHKLSPPYKINNMGVLRHLCSLYPEVNLVRQEIRMAQRRYYKGPRDPTLLTPNPGILPKTAETLKSLYADQRVKDRLSWIHSFRDHEGVFYCPMCGGTGIGDLDHVLPKSKYPELAFFSWNLVLSCVPCNRRRSDKGAKYHLLHPYFDGVLIDKMVLRVRFIPPFDPLRFTLEIDGVVGTALARAQRHFEKTLPIIAFRRHTRTNWSEWHRRFRIRGKRAELQLNDEIDESTVANRNSWALAFMRGLKADSLAIDWMIKTPLD